MKKILLLLFTTLFSAGIMAQSGRKIQTPPPAPPPEPTVVEPSAARPGYQPSTSGNSGVLPQGLLNRQIQTLENGSFRLADYDDKVIVINLWATWCGPCRMEIPDYEEVRKEYAGRKVEFIALTTENPNTSDRVKKFARNYNFGFRLGWADGATARALMNGSYVIPQTFIIAPGGRIVASWRGYSRQSGDRLRKAIEVALPE